MRRPAIWITAALLLCYCGYLVWYFQIEPRRGAQRIRWRMQFNGWNQSPLRVAGDGSMLLLDFNGLRGLDSSGRELWSSGSKANVSVNGVTPASPCGFDLAPDGSVYLTEVQYLTQGVALGSSSIQLRRLDSAGSEQWKGILSAASSNANSAQPVAFSGGVVVALDTGGLEVYDEAGKLLSSIAAPLSTPGNNAFPAGEQQYAVSPAGEIFVLQPGGVVKSFDPLGKVIWGYVHPSGVTGNVPARTSTSGWLCYAPVSGRVYYADGTDLVALDSHDGKVLWTSALRLPAYTAPRLMCSSAGQVLALSSIGALSIYDDQGTARELRRLDSTSLLHLSIDSSDRVYLCDSNRGLVCFDLLGAELWNVRQLKNVNIPPYCAPDGRVYVISDSFLYCIQP